MPDPSEHECLHAVMLAVVCFCSIEYLPIGVFGSIMTIGIMQVDYQLLIQGIQKIVKIKIGKIAESEA